MRDLSQEYNPAPKIRYREKRPKKQKKMEQYKGVKIPSRKVRSAISKTDYEKALEYWDGGCAETGRNDVEMHHVVFRSNLGRGSWRNLVPLTSELHRRCHTDKEYAEYWRAEMEKRFGPWYWADRFDLYKAGLIPNATPEAFNSFMDWEQKKCKGALNQ
ncbi:HNH endonuclease [Alkalicoccobacillus gibsonii]|uniref:HNH endonuclease n=1 Tax=Alkalicoccobacillus gibsonii TaxID=79881 RepID=UPI003F7BCE87